MHHINSVQVNEAQLQYGSSLAGSRYLNRPSQNPSWAAAGACPPKITSPSSGEATPPISRAGGCRQGLDSRGSPRRELRYSPGASGVGSHGRPIFRWAAKFNATIYKAISWHLLNITQPVNHTAYMSTACCCDSHCRRDWGSDLCHVCAILPSQFMLYNTYVLSNVI